MFGQNAFSEGLSLCIRCLQLLLSGHSFRHFCFALFSRVGSTVIVGRLVLVLLCQGGNVQNGGCVLVDAGFLVGHVMVQLKEEEKRNNINISVELKMIKVFFLSTHIILTYLLLSVCQLITHEGHQFGERWTVAGIQSPTLTHHPVPAEVSHGESRFDIL